MKVVAYTKHREKPGSSPYLPDFIADDILDIDFDALRDIGIKHVVFDLDQTLRRAYARRFEAEVLAFLHELRETGGFESVAIMSNNHLSLRRFKEAFDVPTFQPFWHRFRIVRKPSALFFHKVIQTLGTQPHEAVMIGDKLRADVWGANSVGMRTILVRPRGRDYWFNTIILARLRESRSFRRALTKHQTEKK